MADNTVLDAGTGGDTIATDDISGVKFPRGKLTLGADGVNDGDVSKTNPFPIGGNTAKDGTGTEYRLLVDTDGNLQVDVIACGLPSGAATSAKQPALGTAGTASSDVLTVQGIASMTALKVDGSAVTQPVSGTFWQATQPVSVASVPSHDVTNAGTFAVQAAQTGTWTVGLSAGTNGIGKLTANAGVTIGAVEIAAAQTLATVTTVTTVSAVTAITNALPAGTNTIGNVGTLPVTSGGLSAYSFISTAAVQAANIKASAGQVYGLHFFNTNAAARYVRLYNMTGTPATTDTPVWRGTIPGNTAGSGHVIPIDKGIAFGTGIGIRVTAAAADNDATALAASEVLGNVLYK